MEMLSLRKIGLNIILFVNYILEGFSRKILKKFPNFAVSFTQVCINLNLIKPIWTLSVNILVLLILLFMMKKLYATRQFLSMRLKIQFYS